MHVDGQQLREAAVPVATGGAAVAATTAAAVAAAPESFAVAAAAVARAVAAPAVAAACGTRWRPDLAAATTHAAASVAATLAPASLAAAANVAARSTRRYACHPETPQQARQHSGPSTSSTPCPLLTLQLSLSSLQV